MAKCGRKICFHGAFTSKAKAVKKERQVGGFIRRVKMKGQVRYMVLTRKRK